MKTIKTIFAGLFMVLLSGVVIASGNLRVNIESKDADATLVEMSSTKMSNFEVGVTDSFGEKLYSSKLVAPAKSLKKRYDFSGLEDGVYWFKVKIDNETKTSKFEMKDGNVTVLDVRKSEEPTFIHKDEKLQLTYLNHQKEDVKVYVYDSKRTLLAKAELGDDFAIHRELDLSKLRYGNYEIVVTNDLDVYEHQISVE